MAALTKEQMSSGTSLSSPFPPSASVTASITKLRTRVTCKCSYGGARLSKLRADRHRMHAKVRSLIDLLLPSPR